MTSIPLASLKRLAVVTPDATSPRDFVGIVECALREFAPAESAPPVPAPVHAAADPEPVKDALTLAPADPAADRSALPWWRAAPILPFAAIPPAITPAAVEPAAAPAVDGPVSPYTAAEVETLMRRRSQGDSYAEIAVEMGRSPESCRARYHKEKAQAARTRRPPQLWTEAEDRRLRELWEAGETLSAIAAAIGRTDKAIQVRRARLGLEPRGTCIGAGPAVSVRAGDEVETAIDEGAGGAAEAADPAAPTHLQPDPEEVPPEPADSQPEPAKAQQPLAIAQPAPEPDASEPKTLADPASGMARRASARPTAKAATPATAEAAPVSPRVAAIVAALAALDEGFEPSDDLHLVTQRFKGRHWEDIAADLGCPANDAKARWRLILGCRIAQKGGIVTTQGWSDLMAAARLRAGQA